jgi:hypothetical protein
VSLVVNCASRHGKYPKALVLAEEEVGADRESEREELFEVELWQQTGYGGRPSRRSGPTEKPMDVSPAHHIASRIWVRPTAPPGHPNQDRRYRVANRRTLLWSCMVPRLPRAPEAMAGGWSAPSRARHRRLRTDQQGELLSDSSRDGRPAGPVRPTWRAVRPCHPWPRSRQPSDCIEGPWGRRPTVSLVRSAVPCRRAWASLTWWGQLTERTTAASSSAAESPPGRPIRVARDRRPATGCRGRVGVRKVFDSLAGIFWRINPAGTVRRPTRPRHGDARETTPGPIP